ncbi:cytochrome c-type biogenesis protein CcmH [Polynucleobacter paneuropaeus]|jgi:cytochrome c-type biogenesis protein CcmH|uniref:Cytochrome c-type biogenesis protein n=1 Tax=Polynucleobacter paneuropaeus TaxID=2527775 RepID=A0AAE2YM33_9BURK|nr:cytochrome c-type biogenesis protein [Polynucleobacter paneuropaeus]MBT8516536.1 cytochrome c-type biogenesis protein CcmH [Polynucleobacter paneuropaeus]MBT8522165.1 cytochrome c-type biogenesis protein CcmH [Polynucleobacter paneuropaeus]MBT8525226.1 cytochrome c-type biogenesis protein CcmH [Polynucleobacter paneuropaeus]MBT8528602.1 cytochrome c-type biogenesis protein CcmH [Polynucleobacter paneuropaeus]MBT8538300.1 cytochrome c-type biogenesis protein CcmH [Polynucleobacter paneuropae
MKSLVSILLMLACYGLMANEAAPLAEDPVVEQRLIGISEEMRCLVCQNESLAGSRSDLANDLRAQIRSMIKAGKSDAEIRQYMVDRYGDFVLYRPPVKPITWLLWLGPFTILVVGIIGLLMYLRKRNTSMDSRTLSDDENRRLDALLNTVETEFKKDSRP